MKNVPLDLGWKRKDVKLEAEWEEQERDRGREMRQGWKAGIMGAKTGVQEG